MFLHFFLRVSGGDIFLSAVAGSPCIANPINFQLCPRFFLETLINLPPLLRYCVPVRFEFLLQDSLTKSLATQFVCRDPQLLASACQLPLGLSSEADHAERKLGGFWCSDHASPDRRRWKVRWPEARPPTCMFLTTWANSVAVHCSERALQVLWELLWQSKMASFQEPFLMVSVWNRKQHCEECWTSVLFEMLFHTFEAGLVSFPSSYSRENCRCTNVQAAH